MNKHTSVRLILVTVTLLVLVSQFASISVRADTQDLFNETVVVKNLAYFTITRTIDISGMTNVKLQGQIDVVSGGSISVYVMDANGYQQYESSRQARQSALYIAEDVASQTLSTSITTSGTYYVVLDNENSLLTSKTIRVQLSLSFDKSLESSPLLYGAIAAVIVVVAIVGFVFMRRKQKGKTDLTSPVMAVNTNVGFKNCTSCGAVMHELAKTCPACGKQQ